jgi:Mor family transcriptional regulator
MSITAARKTTSKPSAAPLFHGQSTAQQPEVVDDFVCDVLALVRQIAGSVTEQQAAQVDAAVRERWGGDRPYIAKRHGEGRSDRNAAIRRDYQRGESIPLLMRRYQLSRVTIWRVLGMNGEAV